MGNSINALRYNDRRRNTGVSFSIYETFGCCRGLTRRKINWRSAAGSLEVEMHVPDVTLRVNKPN